MRPPILWLAVGFGAGLWAALGPAAAATLLAGAVPVALGAALCARRTPVAAAVAVAALAGAAWGVAAQRTRAAGCAGRWAGGPSATRAVVVRLLDPAPAAGGVVPGQVVGGPCRGAVRLRWPADVAARGGTTWIVAGRWRGDAGRGVLAVRRVRPLDRVPRGRGAARDRVAGLTAALFGARAPLVDALVIGRRAELDSGTRERFVRAGVAHLLAISGLHVGFVAGWLAVLVRLLGLSRRSRWPAAAGVVAYVWLLGFPAPATRAALMLLIGAAAGLRQRVAAPRGVIALAVLVLLIVDPWAVRSVGAWLSVAAVGAVVWAGRATARAPRLMRLVAPAAAATLVTAPITAFAFGTVAPVGVLSNLVAIPLAAVAVPGLLLAVVLHGVAPAPAGLLAGGAGLALALLDEVARVAARVPGGHVVAAPGWGAAALWTAVAAGAWWLWRAPRGPRRRWALVARVAAVAAAASWVLVVRALPRDTDGRLAVHFLDVGQGDAIALRTPRGRWILVDGGPRTPERDAGRRVVLPFLRRHGVDRVSVIVATHGDADHLGGLPAVLASFPPAHVLEPGEPLGKPLYLEFLAEVEASGAAWRPARAGERVELDGVALEVLSPDSAWMAAPLEANEHSVVLLVRFGAWRALLVGDAGVPVEARLAGRVGSVDVLKVGHHGSRTATSGTWLDELRPRSAVISVGARNRYGHPAPDVLARLADRGIAILRTDELGTITFVADSHRAYADVRHHD